MGILNNKNVSSTPSSSSNIGISSSLSLHQMLPWYCFHHLPTSSSSKPTANSSPSAGAVRLIESDGRVKVFKHPVPASEVMRQHPLHLICRSDSFFIGQKVPALPPTEHLQPGHSYFLLPSHFFHSVLSFLTLSSSKDTSAILRSFDITRTDKGLLQVRVKDDDMMSTVYADGEDRSCDDDHKSSTAARLRVCSSEELEKEYRQLVGYCRARRWKPRLETVTEASLKSRRSSAHVMLLLLISRRNKKKVQALHEH